MWGAVSSLAFWPRALIVGTLAALGTIALMQGLRVVKNRELAVAGSTTSSPSGQSPPNHMAGINIMGTTFSHVGTAISVPTNTPVNMAGSTIKDSTNGVVVRDSSK